MKCAMIMVEPFDGEPHNTYQQRFETELREMRDLADWCMNEAPLDGGKLETMHRLLNLLDWMLGRTEGGE